VYPTQLRNRECALDKDRRCGLLFIDFENGDMLQLTGEAWIDWDAPEVGSVTGM
jgi:hypothetical protein